MIAGVWKRTLSTVQQRIWWRSLSFALSVSFLSGCAQSFLGEPSYQGRSLSRWLKSLDKCAEPEFAKNVDLAGLALVHLGTNALPYLRMLVLSPTLEVPSPETADGKEWEAKAKRYASLFTNAHLVGARGLHALGSNAMPVIVELGKRLLLTNDTIFDLAREDLLGIGPSALEVLIDRMLILIDHPLSFHERGASLSQTIPIILEFYPVEALGELLRLSTHERQEIRAEVIKLLPMSGTHPFLGYVETLSESEASAAVELLTKHLEHSNVSVRKLSADCLAEFKEAAQVSVPALLKLFNDADEGVRSAATNAVLAIVPDLKANLERKQ